MQEAHSSRLRRLSREGSAVGAFRGTSVRGATRLRNVGWVVLRHPLLQVMTGCT